MRDDVGASVGAEGQDETAVCHGVVAGSHSCRGCERDASGLLGCSGLVFATAEADKGLVEVVQPGAEHGLPVASGSTVTKMTRMRWRRSWGWLWSA